MLKKVSNLEEEYDIIVAGAGLGGLTAANVLAKRGWKVLLAEQHSMLGGLATYFKRKGHIFDVALHGFPIGMKKTLRKYWSKEMAEKIKQVKSVRFDNPQFSVETTFTEEDFTRILVEDLNVDKKTVNEFYKELANMNFFDENQMNNRELFEKYFPDRNDVVRLLMEPITYANGSTLDEPAITYGIVFSNFMSKGVYTFEGGTDLMLDMMEKELTKNGVDIATCAKVEEIVMEDNKVAGAIINGKKIKCKGVMSNGNLLKTINEWLGEDYLTKEFSATVNKVRLNTSSSQVYIGLKKGESFDYIGDLLFTSTYPEYDAAKLIDKNITSRTFSVYYPDIRPGTDDYTIVASMNSKYEDWIDLSKEEYKEKKQELIDDTIKILDKYIPGIADKIDYTEAATPKTFERYTLHGKGSSFGTKFEGLDVSMNLHKHINGLFHAGSVGIIMSGWLGAANYGVIMANEVDKYLTSN